MGTAADHRRLGVAVRTLRLDGRPIARDDARLGRGWHAPEPDWRWTDGAAEIALAGRVLEVDVAMPQRSWRAA